MVLEDQLIEGLHGDMSGIVIVARNFPKDLRSDPFKFLLGESWVLKNISQKSEPEIDIFFECACRGGGVVFACLDRQRATDKVNLFGQLPRGSGCCPFIQEAGHQICHTRFFWRILRSAGFDQGMDFNDGKEMLFQDEYRHTVGSYESHRCDVGGKPCRRDTHHEYDTLD